MWARLSIIYIEYIEEGKDGGSEVVHVNIWVDWTVADFIFLGVDVGIYTGVDVNRAEVGAIGVG